MSENGNCLSREDPICCTLCGLQNNSFFFRDKFREYQKCNVCSIIFVSSKYHVSRIEEGARYEEHNNDPNDKGYRDFLSQIAKPINEYFPNGANGLDFGCGPTPLLAQILGELGFEMDVFDPFYAIDKSVFDRDYDFVVSTEVFEHLSKPLIEIRKLLEIIKPDGLLAIMTLPYTESIDFHKWHYKNDATHICFYTIETFDWLSNHLDISYDQVGNNIFIFRR